MWKHVYIRLYEACGHNKLCPYNGCPLMFMPFVFRMITFFLYRTNVILTSIRYNAYHYTTVPTPFDSDAKSNCGYVFYVITSFGKCPSETDKQEMRMRLNTPSNKKNKPRQCI